jgi:hypothetical protein
MIIYAVDFYFNSTFVLNYSELLFIVSLVILILILCLKFDYSGPKRIPLHTDSAFGMPCLRANDLIVQEFDSKGNLWASRGMIIYMLKKGDNGFIRMTHVPSGFSYFWLNNFSICRRFTLRPECIEMTVAEGGSICAFSSGKMWISNDVSKKFVKTLKLQNFGKGVGRGIMSTGLIQVNKQELLFGEYFSNSERTSVRIYKYENSDMLWKTVHEFLPGKIRHIHALQKDPYTGKLWICTGDEDKESMIGWSDDVFKNITPIGQGSQIWRTCQLVFTKEAVFWGTDTGSENLAGIYRWDKKNMELTRLLKTDGAVFFGTRLTNGTIVLSTDREGFSNEKDERTRLFILNKDENLITVTCGTWRYKSPGFRFNFAKLRFQRNQGNDLLAISVLNQKEFPDGELLIFNEENLAALF